MEPESETSEVKSGKREPLLAILRVVLKRPSRALSAEASCQDLISRLTPAQELISQNVQIFPFFAFRQKDENDADFSWGRRLGGRATPTQGITEKSPILFLLPWCRVLGMLEMTLPRPALNPRLLIIPRKMADSGRPSGCLHSLALPLFDQRDLPWACPYRVQSSSRLAFPRFVSPAEL